MSEAGIRTNAAEESLQRLEADGKTAMLVAVHGQLTGVIAVADTLKAHPMEAVRALKPMDTEVLMLTADNRRPAEASERQAEVNRVTGEGLPAQTAAKT